jgi:hypothetical protein
MGLVVMMEGYKSPNIHQWTTEVMGRVVMMEVKKSPNIHQWTTIVMGTQ